MNEWIKCGDRMPEVGDKVLIVIPLCGNTKEVERATYRGNGQFMGAWCSMRGYDCAYKVSHWQPSPEMPHD